MCVDLAPKFRRVIQMMTICSLNVGLGVSIGFNQKDIVIKVLGVELFRIKFLIGSMSV